MVKCPKCKEEMVKLGTGWGIPIGTICNNKKCWFFGIPRRYENE